MRAAALVLLAAALSACARPFPPPGGEPDVTAPGLVTTVPEPLAVIAAGNTPAVFRFDERISERGFSEALVIVSPLDSALRVERSGAEVRVRIDGGWRPGRVYRVVLLPGIRDLFGNERREPVELVFSTGAPVGNTALAGIVTDRLTGRPAVNGVVDAIHATQGARYTAVADSSGFYSLRYLPVGEYDVSAYDDQNRNRRRDTLEPVDSGFTAVFAQPTDTVALVFDVLTPDTSAPQVATARAVDSLHVHVEMDDHFDPQVGLATVGVQVIALPDSTSYASAAAIIPEPVFRAEQQEAQLRAAEAARLAADSARAAGDTTAVADTAAARSRPVPPRNPARAAADPAGIPATDATLPIRGFVIRLDRPLASGSYLVNIGGVVNLHGLTGGGLAPFEWSATPPGPEPPPPDTTASSSIR